MGSSGDRIVKYFVMVNLECFFLAFGCCLCGFAWGPLCLLDFFPV